MMGCMGRIGRIGLCLALALLCLAGTGWAWETIRLDVPFGANEAVWRDALADKWHGRTEVVITYGRIDVLTKDYAVELDFLHKFHECLGQALHYADATGEQGVMALIIESPEEYAENAGRIAWIEEWANKRDVCVVILMRDGMNQGGINK
jgi:hypothetical protein